MRTIQCAGVALLVATLQLATPECFAAPWRVAADIGGYELPEDDFMLLPEGFFVDHIASGLSVETNWFLAWRLAMDVSRYDAEPLLTTTYSDPYGESGVTYTPRMYSYVWSLQVGLRGPGSVVSPFLLAGPAYIVQHYKWDDQLAVEDYSTVGLAGVFGVDIHPLSAERRLFVGAGGRFHSGPVVEDDSLVGGTAFNAARKGFGWLVRIGFVF
jgi:hypothetical protein